MVTAELAAYAAGAATLALVLALGLILELYTTTRRAETQRRLVVLAHERIDAHGAAQRLNTAADAQQRDRLRAQLDALEQQHAAAVARVELLEQRVAQLSDPWRRVPSPLAKS